MWTDQRYLQLAQKKKKRNKKRAPELTSAKAMFLTHFNAGRYPLALNVVGALIQRGVSDANVFADAAVASIYLGRWTDALGYAEKGQAKDPSNLACADALSHAHGALKQWDHVAIAGRRALELRDGLVRENLPGHMPLAERNNGAEKDIIAFSLFGGNSKYCETAVLNCVEQPQIYPGWKCCFYVDDSVPDFVIERITSAGGEIAKVDPQTALWPGPMWRLAAYDMPDVRRVIFRDADSVISAREAGAVKEWIDSDHCFHAMRDAGTHTELLLAGLWGVKKGALPSMTDMVADYLKRPVKDAHFADQFFLREYIWPIARKDILQHDSLFGFMDARAFPEGPHRDDFHVGYAEGSPTMSIQSDQPDGTEIYWVLMDLRSNAQSVVCRYPGVVKKGEVTAHIPARFGRLLQTGAMSITLETPA